MGRTERGLRGRAMVPAYDGGVSDRVEEHFRLFNEAVRSQDWTAFLATFAPEAVMRFDVSLP